MNEPNLNIIGDNPGAVLHGNFINYYQFNGKDERLRAFPEMENYWKQCSCNDNKYYALDIGCNSGELTQDLTYYLKNKLPNSEVFVLGVDIDPKLIERAATANTNANVCFEFVDIMNDCSKVEHYLAKHKISKFNAVFCFSITMWIHLNHGDNGLHEFLRKSVGYSKSVFIIEPQPWFCYKTARDRLRKSGQPNAFLKYPDIKIRTEKLLPHIDRYLREDLKLEAVVQSEKTKWKRVITFYKFSDT